MRISALLVTCALACADGAAALASPAPAPGTPPSDHQGEWAWRKLPDGSAVHVATGITCDPRGLDGWVIDGLREPGDPYGDEGRCDIWGEPGYVALHVVHRPDGAPKTELQIWGSFMRIAYIAYESGPALPPPLPAELVDWSAQESYLGRDPDYDHFYQTLRVAKGGDWVIVVRTASKPMHFDVRVDLKAPPLELEARGDAIDAIAAIVFERAAGTLPTK